MRREALFQASFASPVDLLSHCLGEPVEGNSPLVLLDFKMSPQKDFKKKDDSAARLWQKLSLSLVMLSSF